MLAVVEVDKTLGDNFLRDTQYKETALTKTRHVKLACIVH